MTTTIGSALPRIDGPLKVTGAARYSSDRRLPGMVYAVPVCSEIANGRIEALDISAARAMPGVVEIYHHGNIPPLKRIEKGGIGKGAFLDELRPPLSDNEIRYVGQYLAVVIGETFEAATAAAARVGVRYETGPANVGGMLSGDFEVASERGDVDRAFAEGPVTIDAMYETPDETHNPIELHATVALWDGETYTFYESTQAVMNFRTCMAQTLDVPEENIRIICKYLGSGFGGKLWPWTHAPLAAVIARALERPVKFVVTRRMMFETVGHRPRTQQRVKMSARPDGTFTSIQHDAVNSTSMLDDYAESCGEATPYLYSTPNLRVREALARETVGTPTAMRGPGAVPGLFATESAVDELALALDMDPVALRLRNEPAIDESLGVPFSSRHLVECLQTGADRFGWSRRTPGVGSMRADGVTLGWGVAACSWIAGRFGASIAIELRDDGSAVVRCATQDIGTGTYTVLAQIASEATGVPVERIAVELGDTNLPPGPISGGSLATASLVPAVFKAAAALAEALIALAGNTAGSPFAGVPAGDLAFSEGTIRRANDGGAGVPFADILRAAKLPTLVGDGHDDGSTGGKEKPKVSVHSFGAHFVEVMWQPEIARLRVSRVVTVIDAGRIINAKTARNQIEGAIVMGVGMALFEQTEYDRGSGKPLNSNLADYLMVTNADTPAMDVTFLDYPDMANNQLGARGVGEIGLAGVAAAIASAVRHATGVRVRSLPIEIEDLL